MQSYKIVTDSTANLPVDLIEKYGVEVLSLNYYVEGKEYKGYEKGQQIDLEKFYVMMREKKEMHTSLVDMGEATELVEGLFQAGEDVLYLAFSSGLSGTYQAVSLVIKDLLEKYPERNAVCVDTLAAALGEGLLVYYAIQNREKGMSLSENAKWVEENKLHLCHWFTVDDLFFLKRGGRISAATAVVGTALNIKPVLHVDDEGHLIAMGKVRGRKKSLDALVAHMEESVINPEGQPVFISHGGCYEEAEYVAKKVKEKLPVGEVLIHVLDPVIGTHSGPGTMALFFMGEKR